MASKESADSYSGFGLYFDIYLSGEVMRTTAKIFRNGRSQAVRLPAQYRFTEQEVYVRRDPHTGDVILSHKPPNWDAFFAVLAQAEVPADFLAAEARDQGAQNRDPFAGWVED